MLHEIVPEILVVRDYIERRRQAKVVAVTFQQPNAEAVDGAEKSAIERGQKIERNTGSQNLRACALLHLVRGAVCERDYDKLGKTFLGMSILRDLHNSICDCARFAGTGRRDD